MKHFERYCGQFCALIFLLCVAGISQAQSRVTPCSATTPNNALCVTWQPVTTDQTGNPITGVTYRVERKLGSAAFATVQASGVATQFYATSLAVGTHFFRVFANCAVCTAESSASNEVSAASSAIPVIPGSPIIIIAATIRADGPPTYRVIYTVTPREGELVFVAPAEMRAVFAAQ